MKQKPHAELEFVEHEFVEYDKLEIPSVTILSMKSIVICRTC